MISIVVPTWNRRALLPRCVDSVLSQSFTEWELIIVDDGSIDDTSTLLEKYTRDDKRIRYIQLESNTGVANARNIGVNAAKFDYVCFLDSDDEWHKDKLEKQYEIIKSEDNVDFIFSALIRVGNGQRPEIYNGKLDYSTLLRYNFIPLSSVCLKKSILENNRFNNLKHEDYALWLDLFQKKIIVRYLKEPTIFYHSHDDNLTKNKFKSLFWTFFVYRAHRGVLFGLIRFPIFIFYRLAKSIVT